MSCVRRGMTVSIQTILNSDPLLPSDMIVTICDGNQLLLCGKWKGTFRDALEIKSCIEDDKKDVKYFTRSGEGEALTQIKPF